MTPPLMLQNHHLSSPPGLPSPDLLPRYPNQSKKHKKPIQVVFGVYYCIYDFLRFFYDFSSNIQTSLRNVSLECIIFMNFYRVFHL